MSGGVDSSVAAYLMKEHGYDCIGVTMKLFQNEDAGVSRKKSCCSLDDVEDARSVAHNLGIPYYVFNFTADFKKQVMDRFVAAYENGATPNPCIDCNRYLKFNSLYHRAEELGCHYVVTGHYARIEQREDGRYLLKKAADPAKDQSYVLYSLTQEQLAHTMFPLGDMNKHQTRMIADQQNFYNADKPDSQDICFVPDGDYAGFIRRFTGKDYPAGDFTDNEDLFHRELDVEDFNFISFDTPPAEFRAKAKVRYRQKEQWATVKVTGEHSVHIIFDEPQRAITKGQAAVLYDGDVVIGGGVITG